MTRQLILASASPRRRELLSSLDIPFQVVSPKFTETDSNRPAKEETLYFAEGKVRSVSGEFPDHLILGSDTLIECEGEKIGKADTPEEAVKILRKLSCKTHSVFTAVVLLDTKTARMKRHVEEALVTFRSLSEKEIRKYVVTGEPIGKAGAYAVQGKGQKFIIEVKGDVEVVIGLPIRVVKAWLNMKNR